MVVKLLIHERDKDGILRRLPIWKNFIKQVTHSLAEIVLKEEFNATIVITNTVDQDYVKFETEQDMIMFMLKWG